MNLDLWLESFSARRLLLGTHLLVWIVLAAYGLHRLHLIRLYRRRERPPRLPTTPDDWPVVTIQLPIYNERYVVERLLDAAAAVDYPRPARDPGPGRFDRRDDRDRRPEDRRDSRPRDQQIGRA